MTGFEIWLINYEGVYRHRCLASAVVLLTVGGKNLHGGKTEIFVL